MTDVLELAETWTLHMPLAEGEQRVVLAGCMVVLGPSAHVLHNIVQRFRLAPDDVNATVTEVRALLAARGRRASSWEVGPSSTPPDLVERLLAMGMTRHEEPESAGMVLRRAPVDLISEIVVKRAETVDDYVAGFEVMSRVFRERNETPAELRARAEREHERAIHLRPNEAALFIGKLDDVVVAAAKATFAHGACFLSGGATLPHARGRGAYGALIRARYDEAVRQGCPMLVVQAGAMSRPILSRLGFETVCVVQVLVDDVAG